MKRLYAILTAAGIFSIFYLAGIAYLSTPEAQLWLHPFPGQVSPTVLRWCIGLLPALFWWCIGLLAAMLVYISKYHK